MSKAEKFIQENTRNCSQLHYNSACTLRHCITPEQAREAIKIAQEEIYEWLRNHIRNYAFMVTDEFEGDIDVDTAISDLKQAMKDE